MPVILITGANRGLGLELARQYAKDDWRVIACCREPENASELNQLAATKPQLTVHLLDVQNARHLQALAAALKGQPIDVLLNNAGVYGQDDAVFGNTDAERWLNTFHVNTIAPMKIMEAFVENVAASERRIMASMSSKMGSIADNGSGGSYVYRSSKAALNMVMASAAVDLQTRGITCVILHPGWVRTDMGGPQGELSVEQSVTALRKTLANVTAKDNGRFYDIDGSIIPW
jgi:NAD(P)-dependent dehydrogenase (short-subunit alcohol dehydrogenase family)